MEKGFTIIELVVVIVIIAILSAIILFSVTLYINKGNDSNISGSLSVLVPAGEAFYNIGNTYNGFCDPTATTGSVFKNALSQMPVNPSGSCYISTGDTNTLNSRGVCCAVNTYNTSYQSWVACAKEFTTPANIYCVDSRGVKEEVVGGNCTTITSLCLTSTTCQCP